MAEPSGARAALGDHPHYVAAIGMAVGEMALLENQLGRLLGTVLGVAPEIGQTIYLSSHTPFGRVATLDITAAKALGSDPARLDSVKSLTKRARELLQRQNDLPQRIWSTIGGKAQPSPDEIGDETAQLTAHAAQIRELAEEVRVAIDRAVGAAHR